MRRMRETNLEHAQRARDVARVANLAALERARTLAAVLEERDHVLTTTPSDDAGHELNDAIEQFTAIERLLRVARSLEPLETITGECPLPAPQRVEDAETP